MICGACIFMVLKLEALCSSLVMKTTVETCWLSHEDDLD